VTQRSHLRVHPALTPCSSDIRLPPPSVLKLGVLPKPPSPAAPSPCGRSARRRSSLASSAASPGSPGPCAALVRPAWVPRYEDRTLPMSRLMLGKEKGRLCPLSKQALQVLGPTQAAAG
jgi:hypothetical protein